MIDYDLDKIVNIVVSAAKEELLPRYTKVCHQHKHDGSLVTEADLVMQDRVVNKLLEEFPETVVLGEEMTQEQQVELFSSGKAVWCLDPLDGTSNFAFGIPYFAVSLALIENGAVSLGVVYDPIRDECFSVNNGVAKLNASELKVFDTGLSLNKSTAIIDFKRLSKNLSIQLVTESPFASQRNFGASALDWCWLAMGRGHVYLHGSQNIWDYAAGQSIFEASGGLSQTLNGENIFKNALEKRSIVAAVDKNLFKQWTDWIKLNSE